VHPSCSPRWSHRRHARSRNVHRRRRRHNKRRSRHGRNRVNRWQRHGRSSHHRRKRKRRSRHVRRFRHRRWRHSAKVARSNPQASCRARSRNRSAASVPKLSAHPVSKPVAHVRSVWRSVHSPPSVAPRQVVAVSHVRARLEPPPLRVRLHHFKPARLPRRTHRRLARLSNNNRWRLRWRSRSNGRKRKRSVRVRRKRRHWWPRLGCWRRRRARRQLKTNARSNNLPSVVTVHLASRTHQSAPTVAKPVAFVHPRWHVRVGNRTVASRHVVAPGVKRARSKPKPNRVGRHNPVPARAPPRSHRVSARLNRAPVNRRRQRHVRRSRHWRNRVNRWQRHWWARHHRRKRKRWSRHVRRFSHRRRRSRVKLAPLHTNAVGQRRSSNRSVAVGLEHAAPSVSKPVAHVRPLWCSLWRPSSVAPRQVVAVAHVRARLEPPSHSSRRHRNVVTANVPRRSNRRRARL
jgi:hypothetical protein